MRSGHPSAARALPLPAPLPAPLPVVPSTAQRIAAANDVAPAAAPVHRPVAVAPPIELAEPAQPMQYLLVVHHGPGG